MPSSVSSDSATSLVVRLQQNDAVAWEELVEIYAPLIFHWCQITNLEAADCSDVMQEVFGSVAKSISQYRSRPNGSLRGWLWKITQNKIRDLFRQNDRHFNAIGGTEAQLKLNQHVDPFGDQASHESYTSKIEAKQLLRRALKLIQTDFQEQTWQAFWRSTINGEDTASIANALGLSANGVRQAKSRVLRRLREQLGDQ